MSDIPTQEPPPLPSFDINRVVLLRDKIIEALEECVGGVMQGRLLDDAIARLLLVLPKGCEQKITHKYLTECMHPYLGREIFDDSIIDLAWRLAGNPDLLRKGDPIPPWSGAAKLEWVPLQIASVQWQPRDFGGKGKGQDGHLVRALCLAGSPAGRTATLWWSRPFRSYAARQLGFTRARGKFPMLHALELTLLRFCVLLDPAWCRSFLEVPGRAQYRVPPSMHDHNRAVMAKRRRLDFTCPRNYTHECHHCSIGYSECEAGCHPENHKVVDPCTGCGRKFWADATVKDERYCILCRPLIDIGKIPKKHTEESKSGNL